jgi:putative polymerase
LGAGLARELPGDMPRNPNIIFWMKPLPSAPACSSDNQPIPIARQAVAAGIGAPGPLLVISATVFNLVLCFLNTRHWASVSNSGIILVELTILAAGFYCIQQHLNKATLQLFILMSFYLLGIKLINPDLNLKILHDLAIMYVFYKLGTLTSIKTGNKLLWIIMLIVLAFGAFELLAPSVFVNVFDVWSYYVNKGVISQDTVDYARSNLFVSGNRADAAARTFFPGIFGSHRVSSVFLEPVSLGDFAVIAFAWCLSTSTGSLRSRILLIFLAAFCFVLADSRFASICCCIMLIVRLLFFVRAPAVGFLIPVTVMLALTMAGSWHEIPGGVAPLIIHDDFLGRLLFSGRLLNYWGWPQWLGLAGSQVYTADTGYAYFVNNLGLPLALFLLARFATHSNPSPEGSTMKLMMSVYFAASLCIGASVFTIKTAALLWFLYGAADTMPAGAVARARKPEAMA